MATIRRSKVSKARLNLMQWGVSKYGWNSIPAPVERTDELRRVFASPTIRAMVKAGLIKYRPAAIYVTNKGRRVLKESKKNA